MQKFNDAVTATGVRRTVDGYLVADVRAARTGIQEYAGRELGRPDMPVVRVYRPEGEVFARDSLASYAHKPATNDHPAAFVTADTWKKDSIGQIGDDIVRDGDHVRVPLILMDAGAISDYEKGKRELSMGYLAEIVFDSGESPEGETYDAVQRDIRINHIALVSKGRAGSTRIGDWRAPGEPDRADIQSPKENPMSDSKTRTILVDGLSVETTDAGAQAIAKLQSQMKDAEVARQSLEDTHAKAIAAKDADLAKRDAEIDSLKGKVLSDADLDARVQARADLIATAKGIADQDYTGKSDADIRKAAVAAKCGDAAIKDKTAAYIDARFDILAEDAASDPVRKVLIKGVDRKTANDNGYAASVAALNEPNKGGNQ
ncbi:MAG: hypothetical protein CMK46_06995 [Porticoccus sp.]|jgi:hypothetical protein|uniref:DUF2213 domain-containing protein n=1 Tax=Pseudomonadota TaxID=1224 RepID=UPI000C36D587|nr:hypothetical protein [Rhodospirillaceae bacterium]MBG58020.1 hypothetical protein [Porticoccus sp.]QDP49876.1 MAG: hypothetical protein GOVbin132_20 [Prokaryotic dsDNA virus sp.]MAX61626.1 hypothetical protein [Rhodospirillaceae bacterium]MAX61691.1 hypothetical protein [Rhodospirillaceae bacterium]|tara:strand:+ start:23095 stop:24216 length:1122 start_codon:yes stop_codon:yes gene_type:complete